uniref:Uncharacterized protein n=1 Tax=Arcella intermedia TaxID=1963864 RepID=A0A6B2LQU3_9EUKA
MSSGRLSSGRRIGEGDGVVEGCWGGDSVIGRMGRLARRESSKGRRTVVTGTDMVGSAGFPVAKVIMVGLGVDTMGNPLSRSSSE